MSYNFLDKTGLAYFWQKVKAKIPTKTSQLTNDSHLNYSIEKATGTIDDLAVFTSGKPGITGSISLTKKSSGVGSEIPAGWYNYFFSPHRTGSGGDNVNYGTILLTPMTFSGKSWLLRRSSSSTTITEVKSIATGDIPTKVSQLTNDSGYTTNTGTITGINMNGASKGTSGVVDLGTVITAHQDISGKQDKLTAGSNIQIANDTISATDTKYTAGTNVQISGNNVISATDTTYSSKSASSGGTDVSLVTTGEKYTWNNKQNALSSQTAYSAKGTSTKVPQITTNSLGQVTGITEVDIAHPLKKYSQGWGNSLDFYVPIGGQALIMMAQDHIYLLWNPADTFHTATIFGSNMASFSRDSSDKTKLRVSINGGGYSTITALVF